ncbi:hypothetical protein IJ117_01060 [Candidatus Saccharibacteria bacterium]|nr:hypothetical protein [Candidatus Saccharibacteria bacterium]
MDKRKIAILTSSVIFVIALGAMFGLGQMLTQTTNDLGVAISEVESDSVLAKFKAAGEAEISNAAETTLIARADIDDPGFAEPLGATATVWANRSDSLASMIVVETVGIGLLAFVIVFVAIRLLRKAIF